MDSLSTEDQEEREFQRDLDGLYQMADAFLAAAGPADVKRAGQSILPGEVPGSQEWRAG